MEYVLQTYRFDKHQNRSVRFHLIIYSVLFLSNFWVNLSTCQHRLTFILMISTNFTLFCFTAASMLLHLALGVQSKKALVKPLSLLSKGSLLLLMLTWTFVGHNFWMLKAGCCLRRILGQKDIWCYPLNWFFTPRKAKKQIVARPDNMMKWLQVWSVSSISFVEGAVHMPSRHICYVFTMKI